MVAWSCFGASGQTGKVTTDGILAGNPHTPPNSRGNDFERPARMVDGVDLGVEAPIEADGQRHTELDHRRVSLRWLAGTVLVGVAGSGLIGSAVYASLNRNVHFAEAPQTVSPTRREASTGDVVNPRKGDRLVKAVDIIAAKQSFRTPTNVKVGDREVVKTRAFTRVSTTLTLSPTGYADEVPAFNPLKLLAGGPSQTDVLPDVVQAPDDADVQFQTRDIVPGLPLANVSLSVEEIQAQVAEHVKNAQGSGARAPLQLPPQMLLMRTSRAGLDPTGGLAYANQGNPIISAPFSSIQVRMVPENVSLISKTPTPTVDRGPSERLAVVRRNDTLEDILRTNGVGRDQIRKIVAAIAPRRGQAAVSEGHKLKMLFAENENDQPQLARLSIYMDETLESMIAVDDEGNYLPVTSSELQPKPQAVAKRKPADDDEDEEEAGGMRLYDSFYETALKQDIPRQIIDNLVRIFANDVDFQRSVTGGDSFEVFYEESEEFEGRYELLFASITARSETYKYYRYQTADDGLIDFYDENAKSNRKFLIRKPIAAGEQRSGFGRRLHPILRYARMHTGVDWAAPIGTPIVAAGNGTVIKAARESGYGNRVEIQHANGYITTYNHLSGFARGINEGIRVRQGQVIGFLGMTGLATGPHLHYEVIVNGNFVDPLRIKLARTRELNGRQIDDFRRERDRIEGLIAKAPNATQVASAKPPRG